MIPEAAVTVLDSNQLQGSVLTIRTTSPAVESTTCSKALRKSVEVFNEQGEARQLRSAGIQRRRWMICWRSQKARSTTRACTAV